MSFDLTVDAPSMGLLDGAVKQVQMRPMKLSDEKIMFSRKFEVGQKFAQVLCNCTDLDRKTVKEIPFNDIMYFFIRLRNLSVGSTMYNFKLPCSLCNSPIHQEVDLETQKLKVLEDPDEPWEVSLPRNGSRLLIRHMRLGDQFQLDKYAKMRMSKGAEMDPRFVAERLAATLVEVNGEPADFHGGIIFADDLTAVDLAQINSEALKRDFGLDLRVSAECPRCFAEEDYIVRIDPSFFRPPARPGE